MNKNIQGVKADQKALKVRKWRMNMLVIRLITAATALAWLSSPSVAAAQPVPPWDSGAYVYDASGNIVRVGLDEYHYDQANRLTYATVDQQRAHSGLRQE